MNDTVIMFDNVKDIVFDGCMIVFWVWCGVNLIECLWAKVVKKFKKNNSLVVKK